MNIEKICYKLNIDESHTTICLVEKYSQYTL